MDFGADGFLMDFGVAKSRRRNLILAVSERLKIDFPAKLDFQAAIRAKLDSGNSGLILAYLVYNA